jgi:hypothetical protein
LSGSSEFGSPFTVNSRGLQQNSQHWVHHVKEGVI